MKKTTLFIAIVLSNFLLINAQVWNQIGNDLTGNQGSGFGQSVSTNANGDVIAVGAYDPVFGSKSGYVQVFSNVNNNWQQKGADIKGDFSGGWFGKSVSLNTTGDILAIGSPRSNGHDEEGHYRGHVSIYNFVNNHWEKMGLDIDGQNDNELFGWSVSLSDAGNIVSIGAPGNDVNGDFSGQVKVYHLVNGGWKLFGNPINGESVSDFFGFSLSINAQGTSLAVGAPFNDNNLHNSGEVKIFEKVGDDWMQKGNSIHGENANDLSGWAVSFNSNGSSLAIGSPGDDANGNPAGCTRVYKFNDANWVQLGGNIDGIGDDDFFGTSVSLNDYGNILAVGADSHANNNPGYAGIYEFRNNAWHQVGNNINGIPGWDNFGKSICLNAEGRTVAIGGSDANLNSEGIVKVYINRLPIVTQNPDDLINICANDLVQFSIAGSMIDTYSWEVKLKNSNVWSALINDDDNDVHGVATNRLTLTAKKYLNKAFFRCRVTNDFGESISDQAQLVLENELPVITCFAYKFVTVNNGNTYVVQGDEFDPTSVTDNCEIDYYSNNNNWKHTLANQVFEIGTHNVVWFAFDSAGNLFYRLMKIHVSKKPFGWGKQASNKTTNNNLEFVIYPNPTHGFININTKQPIIQKLWITDLSGKIILTQTNIKSNKAIDLSQINSGIYIVNIQIEDKHSKTKLIVE